MHKQLTAIIEREGDGYVALCPEIDIASQGDSVGEARANLKEAAELFFAVASPQEIRHRLHDMEFYTAASGLRIDIRNLSRTISILLMRCNLA